MNLIFRGFIVLLLIAAIFAGCGSGGSSNPPSTTGTPTPTSTSTPSGTVRIIFLHHSTGQGVWDAGVAAWFTNYNSTHGTNYQITERAYPDGTNYPWDNYPYDYYTLWVAHAGSSQYRGQDTLEILTQNYDVIIWKHCFPVSAINDDSGTASITSSQKQIQNYKLQYNALKDKMKQFPSKKFIVWTGAVCKEGAISTTQAGNTKTFFDWVRNTWNETDDNIYLWDFYYWETGDVSPYYLKAEYASSDSHPTSSFNTMVYPYFCQRVVDVIQDKGDTNSIRGN